MGRRCLGLLVIGALCAVAVIGCGERGAGDARGEVGADPAPVEGRVLWRTRREALVLSEGAAAPEWVDAARVGEGAGVAVVGGSGEADAACRVGVVTLGQGDADEVGLYVTAAGLGRSLDALDALAEGVRPGVVVLKVRTRGGRLAEVPFIADVIHGRAKERYRVVAWVEEARSAGALIAMVCDEIVMMPDGALGDAIAHAPGEGVARDGLQAASLRVGEIVSAMGGRDPAIVRAMQTDGALSCDTGPGGAVMWREDGEGAVVVSEAGSPLVLDAERAARTGVSIGTAGDLEGLARSLGCGDRVEWVQTGDVVQRDHRAAVPYVVLRAGELSDAIELWTASCGGGDAPSAAALAEQRDKLDRLSALVESAPFLSRYEAMGQGWLELLARQIDACGEGLERGD